MGSRANCFDMPRECNVLHVVIQHDAFLVGAYDPPGESNTVRAMLLAVLGLQAAMFVKNMIFGGRWRQQWQQWKRLPHVWASFSSGGARDEGVERRCRLRRQRSVATAFEVFVGLQLLNALSVCMNSFLGKHRWMSFARRSSAPQL